METGAERATEAGIPNGKDGRGRREWLARGPRDARAGADRRSDDVFCLRQRRYPQDRLREGAGDHLRHAQRLPAGPGRPAPQQFRAPAGTGVPESTRGDQAPSPPVIPRPSDVLGPPCSPPTGAVLFLGTGRRLGPAKRCGEWSEARQQGERPLGGT